MDIYCLKTEDGRLLHPSIQATVLAKYSRSPDSARNTYLGLSEEEADKFHSKWTISYGHSSVAELAVIPLCFEGISMIASKFIEKYQRAGYSEKSTRYQKFSRDSFINPTGNTTLSNFINRYYDAYEELYPLALENASKMMGGASKDLAKVKARAFDSIRYLLPAGTGTNLAAVMNLRDIRYLISEAKGHNNPEIRAIGESVQKAASDICPSLIGEVLEDNWEPKLVYLKSSKNTGSGVRLLNHNPDNNLQFRKFLWENYSISYDQLDELMKTRGNRRVPQAFRMIDIVLEITMDYGAYRDLQRHRRCEQFSEILTPYYGYEIPDDFIKTPLESKYCSIMEHVLSYDDETVMSDPEILQYIIPMGYRHKSIFKMDLAELYYICELRTKPQGHISYRRIAYQMYEELNRVFPDLMKWCQVIKPDMIGEHH